MTERKVSRAQRRRLARLLRGPSPMGQTTVGEDFEAFPLREVFRMRMLPRSVIGRRSIRGKDLSGADARNAWMEDANFSDCTFARADFRGAHFRRCRFENCRFRRTQFLDAHFEYSAEFVDCRIEDCSFTGRLRFWTARFCRTAFINCRLSNVDFEQSSFEDCSFSGHLHSVQFEGPNGPRGRRTREESAFRVDFREAEIEDISFRYGVDLTNCQWPTTHRLILDVGALLDAFPTPPTETEARKDLDVLRSVFVDRADQPQVVLSHDELTHLAPTLADELWQFILNQSNAY